MKPVHLLAVFDSHTPYLAFRLNAFQDAIAARGLADRLRIEIVLIGAEEASYGWEGEGLQALYKAPVTVLSHRFRGLGMRSFLHPSVPGCLWKLFKILIRQRPKVAFVGGYDRPESMLTTLLGRLWRCKTGVWNDSKFNDAESYGKSIWLELIKSFMVARYHFYLCPGRDSVDYHRFLGGRKKLALSRSWDVVDNKSIGRLANDSEHDEAIEEALQVSGEYFLMPVRFVEKKNSMGVIDAYAQYHQRLKERAIPLVICGKGPQEEMMRQRISDRRMENYIRLVPWLAYEQVPRASRRSRAVLLASTHDQWGMIVNEALAAGAPVLVSNRCGAHELVRNHVNGFTFDPYDMEHLGRLFDVMTENKALVSQMRQEAAKSIDSFSIDSWIQHHFNVLEHFGVLEEEPAPLAETRTVS
ncbi:MAG: glycosyltransferase involved in cell wall biosynthesis [Verrucomicrobiales bacterium]|jgi:glycosyltransferase involved in cell wall biosynthesis